MKIQKPILIAGGIALALGAIWYIKKSEKPAEEFIPTAAPATYYGSQEAAGNFAQSGGSASNFGGGGAPSSPAPGVTTAPEPEHRKTGEPGPAVGKLIKEQKEREAENTRKVGEPREVFIHA